MKERFNVVETDVLVVGSGIAGSFAAITAREAGAEVIVADRAVSGKSGASCMASGVFHHFHPDEDDIENCVKEGVLGRMYLIDQEISRKALPETFRCLEQMKDWGVRFEHKDGKLIRVKGHGSVASRIAVLSGSGGQMMQAIGDFMVSAGIRIVNNTMITDLLTSDGLSPTRGRIVGATGFNTKTGEINIFKSKAVILCAGSWKLPYGEHVPAYQGGDGHAIALRAGAELEGLDTTRVRGVRPVYAMVGSTINIIMGQGAKMTNGLGERYMAKYDPLRREQTERWLLTAATLKELKDSRGPIGLDMTHFTPEQFRLVRAAVPLVISKIEAAGKDITKDKLEYTVWTYPILMSGEGGAKVNEKGETSLKGLYSAGDNSNNARSFTGALPGGAVVGSWAGENAAKYCTTAEPPEIVEDQAIRYKESIAAPLKIGEGMEYKSAWEIAAKIAGEGIGLIKEEGRLRKAGELIQQLKINELQGLAARDLHDLAKVHTIKNFFDVAEAICRVAVLRKESRASSLREDYPETDNINWLKNIIISRVEEDLVVRYEDLPVAKFTYKPPAEKFDQLRLFSNVTTEEEILRKATNLR
ncbi:MAG: FAD-dependent oxidoreductase [Dehalococcoidia bacterium]|nr:FAD-dependent oxidoreductase [Dehalococcoidia bacterium]